MFLEKEMNMVTHKAPCIYVAVTFCRFVWFFVDLRGTGTDCNSALTTENANKMCIVFVTLKYLLFVHSSKYGMIYSSSRFCSRLP